MELGRFLFKHAMLTVWSVPFVISMIFIWHPMHAENPLKSVLIAYVLNYFEDMYLYLVSFYTWLKSLPMADVVGAMFLGQSCGGGGLIHCVAIPSVAMELLWSLQGDPDPALVLSCLVLHLNGWYEMMEHHGFTQLISQWPVQNSARFNNWIGYYGQTNEISRDLILTHCGRVTHIWVN